MSSRKPGGRNRNGHPSGVLAGVPKFVATGFREARRMNLGAIDHLLVIHAVFDLGPFGEISHGIAASFHSRLFVEPARLEVHPFLPDTY
ncbi:MAG: hypothetical protein K8T89_14740 [Planctomycetes bacterium]|nr:hypothetical protein [Planctomycetota bacterium]